MLVSVGKRVCSGAGAPQLHATGCIQDQKAHLSRRKFRISYPYVARAVVYDWIITVVPLSSGNNITLTERWSQGLPNQVGGLAQ